MKRRIVLASAGLAALGLACTWVKLTEGGQAVRVMQPAETRGCESKGRTHAQTTDRVVLFARREPTVEKELQALARNEAALMGGDTIAASTPIERGRQSFDVYRCAKR
jgi:hypothetical protein